jgi:YegS/Rv2252/BmrU family lipid kinase
LEIETAQTTVEIVINAGSGADDKTEIVRRLKELFAEQKIAVKFSLVKGGKGFAKTLEQIAQNDSKIIVAAGGDGTINAVASALVGTEKTLGVLPLGTLNHFSKDLLIPQDLAEAVRVIAENYVTEVDVGEVNGEIFVNNSSLGLYPRMVRRRVREQRQFGFSKWYAAFWASVALFRRFPFLDLRLKIERKFMERRTPFVFVGNNEYEIHSFNIGGRASLQDGILSVYVLHRTGRIGLFLLALRSFFSALREAEDFDEFFTDELTIEKRGKRRRVLVALDGEVKIMHMPLRYRILPRALRVIVPKVENK